MCVRLTAREFLSIPKIFVDDSKSLLVFLEYSESIRSTIPDGGRQVKTSVMCNLPFKKDRVTLQSRSVADNGKETEYQYLFSFNRSRLPRELNFSSWW
jgi:hypothetical protein